MMLGARRSGAFTVLFSWAVVAGCGGIAVFDDGAGGAGASASTSTTSTKSATASTKASGTTAVTNGGITVSVGVTTGGTPCDSHDDCGVISLCSFITGRCAQACGPGTPPCPPNLACLPCGTSSCPSCSDCLAVCGETF